MGNAGDGSCPELQHVIRCENCPVYAKAGHQLLDREPSSDYSSQWSDLQPRERDQETTANTASIVFRLGQEWLALPAAVFKEIAPVRTIHTLPHRSGKILKGLVNVHGALRLCLSLHDLLGIDATLDSSSPGRPSVRRGYERMAVVEREGQVWVFSVDEILGVHRLNLDQLQNVPATVARSSGSYTRGLLQMDGKAIGYLDEELLFYSFKRSIP